MRHPRRFSWRVHGRAHGWGKRSRRAALRLKDAWRNEPTDAPPPNWDERWRLALRPTMHVWIKAIRDANLREQRGVEP